MGERLGRAHKGEETMQNFGRGRAARERAITYARILQANIVGGLARIFTARTDGKRGYIVVQKVLNQEAS
jgi:hypothetical protein